MLSNVLNVLPHLNALWITQIKRCSNLNSYSTFFYRMIISVQPDPRNNAAAGLLNLKALLCSWWTSCVFSSLFRECKQKGLQGKCETRMALLWQEDGKSLVYNPSVYPIVFCNLIHWCNMSSESGCQALIMQLPLPQDVTDFEWMMWFSTFRNHILFALAGHVIFAKIFTLLAPKVRACVSMSMS